MQKIIIIFMLALASVSSVIAMDSETLEAQVEVTVVSEGGIDSTIIEVADGDIRTDVHCYGASCEYNLHNGKFVLDEDMNVSITEHDYYYDMRTYKGGSGMSFAGMTRYIGSSLHRMYMNKSVSSTFTDFLSYMSSYFVTRSEYGLTVNNQHYDSYRIDELVAKVSLLEGQCKAQIDPAEIERQTALVTSHRIGQPVKLKDGTICDYAMFGACVRFDAVPYNIIYNSTQAADERIMSQPNYNVTLQ